MARTLFPVKFLLFLALVLAAWLGINALSHMDFTASAHALVRHGEVAVSAENCFNGGGAILSAFFDPVDGRKASICKMGGSFFVSIDRADGENVTMFRRDFARCLRDVIDYVTRSGFTEVVKELMVH